MESLKDMHKTVRATLYEWGYAPTDIVHFVDIGYAAYLSIGTCCMSECHIVCMCLSGDIVDYGYGLYGINEESTA